MRVWCKFRADKVAQFDVEGTTNGTIVVYASDPAVIARFVPGKSYYLDVRPDKV